MGVEPGSIVVQGQTASPLHYRGLKSNHLKYNYVPKEKNPFFDITRLVNRKSLKSFLQLSYSGPI